MTCPSLQLALDYIRCQEGVEPTPVSVPSASLYYRCGNSVWTVRYNRKATTWTASRKKLKQGRYLDFYTGKIRSAIVLNKNANVPSLHIDNRHISDYSRGFERVVLSLQKLLRREDAEDIAQDAFMKIYERNETGDMFINIWKKRATWDAIEASKLIRNSRRCNIEDVDNCAFAPHIEIRFANFLSSPYQKLIIDAMQQGYTVTDIAELTGRSFASVSCARNRAVGFLKKIAL